MSEIERDLKAEIELIKEDHSVESDLKAAEDRTAETDLIVQETIESKRRTEIGTKEENQWKHIKGMTKKKIEKKKAGGEQVHHPEEGDIGKKAQIMNMIEKKEGAEEEATHQNMDIEEETPVTINEGGAQGP